MRFVLLFVVAIAGVAGTLEDQVVAQERAELECLKTGDMTTFASLLADDAVFVDARGADGKATVVEHTAAVRLHEYTMSEVKVIPISADSAMIVYKLAQRGSSHGKEFAGEVRASALWVKRSGKWQCVFSQETAAK